MRDDILLVDDDPGAIRLMGRILQGLGNISFATSGEEALRFADTTPPDLILLDVEMRGLSGFRVLDALRARDRMANVPVLFVSAHGSADFQLSAFESGASDFIVKPVIAPLLVARVAAHLRQKRMVDGLRQEAATDSLTKVANRGRFEQSLEREWQQGQRAGDPLSLLLIDVDHFKMYNDTYGHPQGDSALRRIAQVLADSARRAGDVVARYGGEEFAMVLPNTGRVGAEHVARRILNAVAALNIPHATSPTAPHITVSIGISCFDECSPGWCANIPAETRRGRFPPRHGIAQDLVASADRALYRAKSAGRARAVIQEILLLDTVNTALAKPA